jgi:GST-like protein
LHKLKLFGEPGWGSVLAETQLVWYGVPFEFSRVGDLFKDGSGRQELEAVNPLGQIPTLVLPDGSAMTESAAITLWLADQAGSFDLVPRPDEAERPQFLRWLLFITSNIYPTYTYADDPSRFVHDAEAQQGFADTVHAYARKLYVILEAAASGPWFLGSRFSALDIYICTLTHWEPGRPWFDANAPKLVAIAEATQAIPRLSQVWARNFPQQP